MPVQGKQKRLWAAVLLLAGLGAAGTAYRFIPGSRALKRG